MKALKGVRMSIHPWVWMRPDEEAEFDHCIDELVGPCRYRSEAHLRQILGIEGSTMDLRFKRSENITFVFVRSKDFAKYRRRSLNAKKK